ncbi:hypothetical protein [Terriglobus roseus]|uniref:Uncharacterized protein n=1 Tax=Terriglobus roseus TaxID=392734 RepID=A0A1G7MZH7_9BACT|nr:hypothetical protein [Terriglobus roseus]SDF67245.1 hypothetical protein SAMN05444167_2959 [Terriglobus roseus]
MPDEQPSKGSFFTTLPGVLTGIAAVLTALTGFWAIFHHDTPANPPKAAIIDGPPSGAATSPSSGTTPQSTAAQTSAAVNAGSATPISAVSLTSRKQLTTRLEGKTFHHNMTGTMLNLDSGQTIDFEKLRQIDFGNVNGDAHLVAVTITLNDGRTVPGDLPTNYAFAGDSDLGPFTIFVQDVRQIVFTH